MTEQQRNLMAYDIYTTVHEGYAVTGWHQLRDCEQFRWLGAAEKAWERSEGFRLVNARDMTTRHTEDQSR